MSGTLSAGVSSVMDFAGSSIMANSANAKAKRASLASSMMNYYFTNQLMDKQNEYNKPINQMARLREAGLNPNLVYDNGNAIIASAGGSAQADTANVTPSSGSLNLLQKMQVAKSMEQQDANIRETDARTDAIDANISLKRDMIKLAQDKNEELVRFHNQLIKRLGVQNVKSQAEIEHLKNKFDWKNPNDWRKLNDEFANPDVPYLW